MEQEIQKPKVGVGVMIFKDRKVLLGKRRSNSSHGAGEYSFPGGNLEYMEDIEDCIKREVLEETGIKIKNIKFQSIANVKAYTPRHVVLIALTAEWEAGEVQSFKDERIGEWAWYGLDNLPKPLFKFSELMIKSYKTGQNYFDKE